MRTITLDNLKEFDKALGAVLNNNSNQLSEDLKELGKNINSFTQELNNKTNSKDVVELPKSKEFNNEALGIVLNNNSNQLSEDLKGLGENINSFTQALKSKIESEIETVNDKIESEIETVNGEIESEIETVNGEISEIKTDLSNVKEILTSDGNINIGSYSIIGEGIPPISFIDNSNSDVPGIFPEHGVYIANRSSETAGIHLNGDNIVMWTPCDEDAIRVYDEDDFSDEDLRPNPIARLDHEGCWYNKEGYKMVDINEYGEFHDWVEDRLSSIPSIYVSNGILYINV